MTRAVGAVPVGRRAMAGPREACPPGEGHQAVAARRDPGNPRAGHPQESPLVRPPASPRRIPPAGHPRGGLQATSLHRAAHRRRGGHQLQPVPLRARHRRVSSPGVGPPQGGSRRGAGPARVRPVRVGPGALRRVGARPPADPRVAQPRRAVVPAPLCGLPAARPVRRRPGPRARATVPGVALIVPRAPGVPRAAGPRAVTRPIREVAVQPGPPPAEVPRSRAAHSRRAARAARPIPSSRTPSRRPISTG